MLLAANGAASMQVSRGLADGGLTRDGLLRSGLVVTAQQLRVAALQAERYNSQGAKG